MNKLSVRTIFSFTGFANSFILLYNTITCRKLQVAIMAIRESTADYIRFAHGQYAIISLATTHQIPDSKPMPINMNFNQVAISRPQDQHWERIEVDGISRVYLEHSPGEPGHASSLVEFSPGVSFAHNEHVAGEEAYVLEGVFSDEYGDYPAGTYLRNPPGSSHAPFSREGCKLFVKINQFQAGDNERIVIRPDERQWQPGIGNLRVAALHVFGTESTALVHWPANEHFQLHRHYGGEEILVLEGTFRDEHGDYPAGSWIRSPHMSQHNPYVREETLIMVKVGHLPDT
jgi:anti-sigma factor ChrR (cupin superfamily)